MGTRKRIAFIAGGLVLLVLIGLAGAYAASKATEKRQERERAGGPPPEVLADCPWGEASCVLAISIEWALQFGHVDAVVDFGEPRFYDCPGRPQQAPDEPFPLCEGNPEFTREEGFPVAHRYAEGSVVDAEGLGEFIRAFVSRVNADARDDAGGGQLRLYAFGCAERATLLVNVSCARLAIILSAIVGENDAAHRELLVFWAVGLFGGETLPVAEVWDGPLLEEERSILFETGGYLPDLGEIHVIDQSMRRVRE